MEGGARVLVSQPQALRLAFPAGVTSATERRTAYLSPEQAAEVERLAQAKLDSRIWSYYVGRSSAGVSGYAYFDKVVVRTMPAVLMAALDASGRLRFLEVLSFEEPEDYLPARRWLELFPGRDPEGLRVPRSLPNVSGATLSAHALSDSARRMLAVHRVLHP